MYWLGHRARSFEKSSWEECRKRIVLARFSNPPLFIGQGQLWCLFLKGWKGSVTWLCAVRRDNFLVWEFSLWTFHPIPFSIPGARPFLPQPHAPTATCPGLSHHLVASARTVPSRPPSLVKPRGLDLTPAFPGWTSDAPSVPLSTNPGRKTAHALDFHLSFLLRENTVTLVRRLQSLYRGRGVAASQGALRMPAVPCPLPSLQLPHQGNLALLKIRFQESL